jgi:NADH-quinone oxidoreductase F subunit
MYNRTGVGKYHLQVDTCVPAMLAGADEILTHLENVLGIQAGETTDDEMFTLTEVQDLAACGTCPVIQVNERYYENMTTKKVDALLDSLRKGEMPDTPDESNFASECNVLLKRRGAKNSTSIDTYLADDGYAGLEKALDTTPDQIVQEVKKSYLRGLGGAGFPTGTKWSFLAQDTGKDVYLICNADEGEPGTFKDRQIMQYDPHLLIEGMAIAGYAIGAKLGFIYIRGEFGWIADILENAVTQAKEKGKLGSDILGKGFDFDIVIHRGAGSYICGEETALIESLEGKRGDPRIKPPFPAVEGLYGCPTIVNNVETLASIPYITVNGADAYKKFGTTNNFGFKIFGVSGHVNKPGAYEFALGTPLDKILETAGGVKGALKAVIVGGLSVPILTAEETKGLHMDFDSCLGRGTMLGSGGIIVINETTSIPQVALRTIKFYEHESCGQCTPCREGTWLIKELLEGIVAGRGSHADIDRILQLCETVKGSTLCPTGEAFAMPIIAMLSKFRAEFEALITN